jgi:hypothetical protein
MYILAYATELIEGRKVIDKHINHSILNLFTGEKELFSYLMERFFPSQFFWQLITSLPHANVKNHFNGLTRCAQNLFSKITSFSHFIGTS